MSTLLAIEQTISSFQALHEGLGLRRANDASFFPEWQAPVIELADDEKAFLDHLQRRYQNYYHAGLLTEGTVLFSIVAPLLERLGFHEPPFFVRSEVPIRLEVEDRDVVYRGRIDVLVIRDRIGLIAPTDRRRMSHQMVADLVAASESEEFRCTVMSHHRVWQALDQEIAQLEARLREQAAADPYEATYRSSQVTGTNEQPPCTPIADLPAAHARSGWRP